MVAKLYDSPAFLRRRYVMERRTLKDIAEECDTSIQTISRKLKEAGLR
jgi:DNA-directed RNA polymerase specialized sigma subunit